MMKKLEIRPAHIEDIEKPTPLVQPTAQLRNAVAFSQCLARHTTASSALHEWCSTCYPNQACTLRVKVVEDLDVSSTHPMPKVLNPDGVMRFRRVDIMWGERIVSRAVNWYLPNRLPAGIADSLRNTCMPFGILVRPYGVRRHMISSSFVDEPDCKLIVRAMLVLGATEIAEVEERYPMLLPHGLA